MLFDVRNYYYYFVSQKEIKTFPHRSKRRRRRRRKRRKSHANGEKEKRNPIHFLFFSCVYVVNVRLLWVSFSVSFSFLSNNPISFFLSFLIVHFECKRQREQKKQTIKSNWKRLNVKVIRRFAFHWAIDLIHNKLRKRLNFFEIESKRKCVRSMGKLLLLNPICLLHNRDVKVNGIKYIIIHVYWWIDTL